MSRWMRVVLALAPALVCAAIAPGWFWYFDITPKILLLQVGAVLALAALLFNPATQTQIWSHAVGRRFIILLTLQAAILAISTSLSLYPDLSIYGTNWRRLGLISWAAIMVLSALTANALAIDRRTLRWILRSVVWSGGLVAGYGVFQYFGMDPFIPPSSYLAGQGEFTIVRPPGTLGQADYFGCYLLFVIWYGLALAGSEKERLRTLAIGISMLACVALVLTGTRAALLGLIVSGAAAVPFYRRLFRARYAAIAIGSCLLCGLFVMSPFGTKLRARVVWSFDDTSGGARPQLWKDALRMAATRPLQGFGPATFSAEFPQFQSLKLAQAYPNFYHESPHNMFLDAAASQGFPSALVLAVLIAHGLRTAWRLRLTERPLAVCLGATLVAATVCQQFMVFIAPTCLLFYLTLAMLTGISITGTLEPSRSRLALGAIIPASVALVLIFGVAGVRLAVSDAMLAKALKEAKQKNVEGARRYYGLARAWQLPGVNSDLLYSRVMAAASNDGTISAQDRIISRQEAIRAAMSAPDTTDDKQNAYYSLAMLMVAESDLGRAESNLRFAIAAAPNWFKPHWALAKLLQLTGRHSEALAEADAAVQRNGGKNPEVEETRLQLRAAPF